MVVVGGTVLHRHSHQGAVIDAAQLLLRFTTTDLFQDLQKK